MSIWGRGAFALHIIEAIEINTERMPLYAKLSDGESLPLSKRLIRYERLTLPFAALTDWAGKRHQKNGIKVVESEFVPMSLAPKFSETYPFAPEPLSAFQATDGAAIAKKISAAKKQVGFAEASRVIAEELHRLEEPRAYHCMMRHLLESLLRIANLAPLHIARARELGVPTPNWLCDYLLWSHLPLLKEGTRFDVDAARIQSRNIPFLWQDLPPIAPTEKIY